VCVVRVCVWWSGGVCFEGVCGKGVCQVVCIIDKYFKICDIALTSFILCQGENLA
jgi:hypothetical protein